MRETLDRTTEEQLLLQNEAEGQSGVIDTDRAYHEIEKKHQLVQSTPEPGMAEQEMHDEATGKKLVCETGVYTFALSFLIITIIYTVQTRCVFTLSVLSLIPPIMPASLVQLYFQFELKFRSAALNSSTCVHWCVKWKYLNHLKSSQMFVCPLFC